MSDIRYVCLSDTHFGAATSLLTNLSPSQRVDVTSPSPTLTHLMACLRGVIETNGGSKRPTLVLNGDVLELALSSTDEAVSVFLRFVELFAPPGETPLFERIVYIPGNHDHHLWETARETQYLNNYLQSRVTCDAPVEVLEPPWHATKAFDTGESSVVESRFLQQLVRLRSGRADFSVQTRYPNYGVVHGDRCVVFHHGQFTEAIYALMSEVYKILFPGQASAGGDNTTRWDWDIEVENFAWIDFFWSTLGRSGKVGDAVGAIYQMLEDKQSRKKLTNRLARELARRYGNPGLKRLQAFVAGRVFDRIIKRVEQLERQNPDQSKHLSTSQELRDYVLKLHQHLIYEINAGGVTPTNTMPAHVSLVIGHTHRPFAAPAPSVEQGDSDPFPQWKQTHNSGGWVVDLKHDPRHGGAIVLLDEALNIATLQCYTEGDYAPKLLNGCDPEQAVSNEFAETIARMIEPANQTAELRASWQALADAIEKGVRARRSMLEQAVEGFRAGA